MATGPRPENHPQPLFGSTVAGYLDAHKGCKAVRDLFVKEGGTFLQQQVKQEAIKGGKATSVTLANGTVLEADQFIFACGPWVTRLFLELTKKLIVTRALVFFFASPAGQSDFMENKLPIWMDRDMAGPFRSVYREAISEGSNWG